MADPIETKEQFWIRYAEAERSVTARFGKMPNAPEPLRAFMGALAGGASAMLALALAGVHGDRLSWITLIVATVAGTGVYFTDYYRRARWDKELIAHLEATKPKQ